MVWALVNGQVSMYAILTSLASTKVSGRNDPFCLAFSRRSVLQPTRMTGMCWPHIDLTSSYHLKFCNRGRGKLLTVSQSIQAKTPNYLICNIVQAVRRVNAERNQDHVGLRIA